MLPTRQAELEMLQDPNNWPVYPYLPIKRRTYKLRNNDLGILYAHDTEITIYHVNLYELIGEHAKTKLEQALTTIYDTYDELLDDGWIVDGTMNKQLRKKMWVKRTEQPDTDLLLPFTGKEGSFGQVVRQLHKMGEVGFRIKLFCFCMTESSYVMNGEVSWSDSECIRIDRNELRRLQRKHRQCQQK